MDVELVPVECASCHVLFWLAKSHNDRLRQSHDSFYCPSGHSQWYAGETDAQKLQKAQQTIKEKEAAISRLYEEKNACEKDKKAMQQTINGYKGQFKKREKHGSQKDSSRT